MVTAVMFGGVAAFAQTGAPVTGRVVMKDADGKENPVPNALVEVYRIDTNTSLPADKTNKKGDFGFANFQFGAVYALVISGEGIDPAIFPNVRAGASNLNIVVTSGNGKKLTEEEVRDQLATVASGGTATTEPSADEKKSAEDLERKRKELEVQKAKAEESFAVASRLLKEGNEAYSGKNYDLAITKFEEGYQSNPEFLGSAPGFLNNKGIALGVRAVDSYNKGVKAAGDKQTRDTNYAKAVADFDEGIDAFHTSWTILSKASEADKAANSSYAGNRSLALSGAKTLLGYAVQTERVNSEKLDKVRELLEEYAKAELDKMKQAEAITILANYYRMTGDFNTAITEYRKALSIASNEPGALFGLGISLVSTGYNDDGTIKKDQQQEAANHLKRFVDSSPTNKKYLKDANDTLELLKSSGITPKK